VLTEIGMLNLSESHPRRAELRPRPRQRNATSGTHFLIANLSDRQSAVFQARINCQIVIINGIMEPTSAPFANPKAFGYPSLDILWHTFI
jgi:hypothetical protein